MPYSLIAKTDEHMTRRRVHFPRNNCFYPSEASVTYIDQHGMKRVEGTCLRQAYWRVNGEKGSAPNVHSEWIFALGKSAENILIEQWKQMGIWVDNNIKFFDEKHNVSGEIDALLIEPETGRLYAAECKTFYGYYATKEICGSAKQEGRPKTSHLMQLLIYIDIGKRYNLLEYGKLIYYARDSAKRAEFDIDIIDDNGLKRPTINGVIDYRFTIEEIFDRFDELGSFIKNKEIPPRDYQWKWNDEKIEKLKLLGEISKTAYENWQKNPSRNFLGDWNCAYCPFLEKCNKTN